MRKVRRAVLDSLVLERPHLEVVYQNLVTRDLSSLGIVDDFYPVMGAANYSLFYLILRIVRPVLDLGAGQGSLLLSRLQEKRLVGTVLTVEHDADWAGSIRSQVSHEVLHSPLTPQTVAGYETQTYDWAAILAKGPFDLVVCDGPVGAPTRSRWGVINVLQALGSDFVVIMDDAERPGERETIKAFSRLLYAQRRGLASEITRAEKVQHLFAGGAYKAAAYF